jgi:hypothetical protein
MSDCSYPVVNYNEDPDLTDGTAPSARELYTSREDFMRQILFATSLLFSAALLYAPLAHADDVVTGNAYVIAQGVPGAPHGGPTGTGGDSGVNDHDAGTDINDSYNNPSHAMSSSTSALDKTTSGHQHHHSRNSENNNMNPPGTYGGSQSNAPGADQQPPSGSTR